MGIVAASRGEDGGFVWAVEFNVVEAAIASELGWLVDKGVVVAEILLDEAEIDELIFVAMVVEDAAAALLGEVL